jgi:ABC-type polysaccharide/polyol phosphate transport system ATPase subunit
VSAPLADDDLVLLLDEVVKTYPPEKEAHPVVRALARLGGVELSGGTLEDVGDDDDDDDVFEEEPPERDRPDGAVEAIRGVSLAVEAGTCVALVGPAGSGKSVLLRLIAGLTPPTEGRIVVRGSVAPALRSLEKLAPARMGIRKQLLAIAMMTRLSRSQVKRRLPEIFELAGLSDSDVRLGVKLSARQLDRVLLAMMLSVDADLLLVDVPVEAGPTRDRLVEQLRRRVDAGAAAILAAAPFDPIVELADRVVYLEGGRVVLDDDEARAAAPDGRVDAPGPETPALPLSEDAQRYRVFLQTLVGERRVEKAHQLAAMRAPEGAEEIDWRSLAQGAGFDWTQHQGAMTRLRRRDGLPPEEPREDEPVDRPLSGDAQRYLEHLRVMVGDERTDEAHRNAQLFSPPDAGQIEWSWLARWAGMDVARELNVVERLRAAHGVQEGPIFGAARLQERGRAR